MFPQFGHEHGNDARRHLVHTIVVVAKLREISLCLIIHDQSRLIANHLHARVPHCGQAIRDDREARDAKGHRAHWRIIVQRHLDALVRVFVVHVVDHVHGVDIHFSQPFHHALELRCHVFKIEVVALDWVDFRPDLLAADLVAAAVDGVEKAFGEVRAGAEELHLLAHEHWRNTAGNCAVIAPRAAHGRVALELQRAGINGDFCGEFPEVVRQPR
jgi:hypothetical protein